MDAGNIANTFTYIKEYKRMGSDNGLAVLHHRCKLHHQERTEFQFCLEYKVYVWSTRVSRGHILQTLA